MSNTSNKGAAAAASHTDQQLISEGRKVVRELENRQWGLGDLAREYAGDFDPEDRNPRLIEYANAIGVEVDQLRGYQRVATAWPTETRDARAPWSCHRELSRDPNRVATMAGYITSVEASGSAPSVRGLQSYLGKTPTPEWTASRVVEQAERAMEDMAPAEAERIALKTVNAMTPGRRLDLAEATLRDPDVVKEQLQRVPDWSSRIEVPEKPQPTGNLAETAEILWQLGQSVERWSLHLESPMVLELLKSSHRVDSVRRVATREKLERLARAASHAATLLVDETEQADDDVIDVEFRKVPPRLNSRAS
jgi:hypothetical protein